MTAKSTLAQDGVQVLTINGGSSSIKFALYQRGDPPKRGLQGKIDRIGLPGTSLAFHDQTRDQRESQVIGDRDHAAAAHFLCDWLAPRIGLDSIGAVGHRIVNGGAHFYEPQHVTRALLDELRRISAYAPEHLPAEIAMIDLFNERAPGLPQVACFDTAFHRDMPRVARILPILRRFQADGVERYGFHGLSYAYLTEELARVAGAEAALGKVVLFCYQVKKWFGAFAAALGGLDTLVFAGGIGENSSVVRSRICEGLGFVGIQLGEIRNAAGEPVISADASRAKVRVIRTDEDMVIAKAVFRILGGTETMQHTQSP